MEGLAMPPAWPLLSLYTSILWELLYYRVLEAPPGVERLDLLCSC